MQTKPENIKTTVQKWLDAKGFGFLRHPNGREVIFVHRNNLSGIAARDRRLLPNSEVWCEVRKGEKGWVGHDVHYVLHGE
jgi:cold shock CspA family protein